MYDEPVAQFSEGDYVVIVSGEYPLICNSAQSEFGSCMECTAALTDGEICDSEIVDWDTSDELYVVSIDYDASEPAYNLSNDVGQRVWGAEESDLRRAR